MKKWILIIITFFITGTICANPVPDKSIVYKNVIGIELSMHFFFPPNHKVAHKTPTIVFFHGGGWTGGVPSQFFDQSAYFASRGMVAISVQYRTKKANNTTPIECVKDGKSAIRWIRSHASAYGINPNMLVAGGGSAGGHIAAATAILKNFNEESDDLSISCIPDALVLFNPVVHNGPEGYGYARVKAYWERFSPYHNLTKNIPPTIIMLGTKDKLFNPILAKQYKQKMEEFGNRCDLLLYQGQDHAFFNKGNNEEMHYQTIKDADRFLTSLDYLKKKN